MQVALDVLRGFLALALVIVAVGAIIYFVVPGVGEMSPDRAVQSVARGRMMTSMFGGLGLIFMMAFFAIAFANVR